MRVEEHAKDVARLMAERSDCEHFRHGAVIIQDGEIIALGRNHRIYNHHAKTRHAEVDAICHTNIRGLRGATIVVFGKSKAHRQLLSQPCPNCHAVLKKLGFKRVIFSTPSGWEKENL